MTRPAHSFFKDEKPPTDAARMAEIRQIFDAEVKADKPAVKATDIPITYRHMTPEFLANVLCGGQAKEGVKCLGFKLGDDDDGTSNRM